MVPDSGRQRCPVLLVRRRLRDVVMYASSLKLRGLLPALVGGTVVAGSLLLCNEADAQSWPTRVHATYKIQFNGFNIGKFSFLSQADKSGYQATTSAKLRAFFGVLRWKGTSHAKGKLGRLRPRPAAYSYTYRSKSKRGSLSMKFRGSTIASVTSVPPTRPSSKRVPVKPTHLKGVLDPLSAVIALTKAQPARRGSNPCKRTLAIFDGWQRFNLVFSYHRQIRIPASRSGGASVSAYVCRVRYVPISGYKPKNKTTRYMAKTTGIEVVLRPVPEAGILVPYKITVPTIIGSATAVARRIAITTSGHRQIALVH